MACGSYFGFIERLYGALCAEALALRLRASYEFARQSERAAAGRGHTSESISADTGRRGQWQNARADYAHCMADSDRTGLAPRRASGHVHQQGREGNADAAFGNAAH